MPPPRLVTLPNHEPDPGQRPMIFAAASGDVALVLIELGATVLALAVLGRIADRFGISPIPLYLLAGLTVGQGGIVALDLSESFISLGSEIGVVLLLVVLGLEYSADELVGGLRTTLPSGMVDLVLNFVPGLVVGLILGWGTTAALLMGGVTYVSSSGIIAKLLSDLDRTGNRETPTILSLLVIEDLAMAAYLPIIGILLAGRSLASGALSVTIALAAVAASLVLAVRHGKRLSRLMATPSDEVLLLTVLGSTLLFAGIAQQLQVSSAVGAFLVGVALSGPVSERAAHLLGPLRDLFAATFFLFFSLQIDPADLPAALPVGLALAVVTCGTKLYVGMRAARLAGVGPSGQKRAGAALVSRGEFSIVIAGLGVSAGIDDVGPLSAAYVLLLAGTGPMIAKYAERLPFPRVRARS